MSDTRVVLVKPGDVLIFGNVGHLTPEAVGRMREPLEQIKNDLRLSRVLIFEADIDLAAVPEPARPSDPEDHR